jgi:hypothetical protein
LSGSSSEDTAAVISLELFHDATLSMLGDRCLSALHIQLDALLNLCTADGGSKGSLSPPIPASGCLAHVEFRCLSPTRWRGRDVEGKACRHSISAHREYHTGPSQSRE